jgi:hypothetical protein
MKEYFSFDARLGILLPDVAKDWECFNQNDQQSILLHWEQIRGSIPDRIAELENKINKKQAMLSDESDFPRSCELNTEIAELASIINDLWIWYRTNQSVSANKVHA